MPRIIQVLPPARAAAPLDRSAARHDASAAAGTLN
jgi:hypothetical protein